jgi:hypothetical protein
LKRFELILQLEERHLHGLARRSWRDDLHAQLDMAVEGVLHTVPGEQDLLVLQQL